MSAPLSRDRLARIVADEDPVRRNFAITRTYFALSEGVADVVGRRDANWLTFGTWASATAGRFIRGDAVPVRWGAGAVADGNRAIIADIGPRFVRFLDLAGEVPAADLRARVAADPLLTGTPEVAEAFDCYAQVAAIDPDESPEQDRRQALLMLRANVLVAHHEQWFADDFVDSAIPLGGLAAIVATRFVSLGIPDGELDVCRDVPRPRYLGGRQWPDVLDDLPDERIRDLAQAYDQALSDTSRSDAPSWQEFRERMGYILCFFRAYQRDPALFALPPDVPPYDDPSGALDEDAGILG
ncbi:MAG: hypothetical protein R2737_09455 [Candidatus Nanopelagicales bacterium]